MPPVIWNDSLSISIPELNSQHKQSIDRLNILVDARFANRGKEEIKGIVDFLDLYIAQHFGFEENFRQKYKGPVTSKNRAAHTKLIKTLSEVKQELKTKESSLSLAIKVKEQLTRLVREPYEKNRSKTQLVHE
ncbi:hemerythrin domain-containing protein [Microcoleus sp. AT9_B5]